VWVESTGIPGEGSTFHVTFTLGTTDMTPTALRRDGSFAGRRALVVDDNATNRALIGEMLGAWGIEATEAVDGEAALAAFDASRPDVVVLDMLMPGPDGLEVAARLRERVPGLPLVLTSSMSRRELEADRRWTDSGIGAFVQKPVKASPLHAAIATVLGVAGGAVPDDAIPAIDPELGTTHPLRILLAEDNVVNQVLALKLLDKLGYRADVAANGVEALEALGRRPYDLLLSDIQMPEMDGVELTRRVVERWEAPARPWIIAMTAEAMAGDRERFLAAGMNDYVMKPIRIEDLVAAIRRAPRRADGATLAAEVSPASLGEPVDEDVLARLAASVGNDRAFVSGLIGQFTSDAPELLGAARAAAGVGDAAELRRAAHTLKSNAATFGASELTAQSRALEKAAKAGDLDGAAARIDGLERELDRVSRALARYLDGRGG
jgi:CheY-like chemotaxis protein/HPt (histidine-containing phosphotransfer) domain-containing protein